MLQFELFTEFYDLKCYFSTERMLQTDPDYLEKWEKELEKKGQTESKKKKFNVFKRQK